MGALMRSVVWGSTPLGPVEGWPQSLRTAASILLDSKFPMYIAWGPEYVQMYNEGYRPILGSTKHPAAMGRRASETFAESWHIIGPMFDGVRAGEAVGAEDWMLPLDRHGYLEECFFTFSYSPIRDESGGVGGVLVTVSETTGRVLNARRLRALHELAERTAGAPTADEACRTSAAVLSAHQADVPFALFYLLDDVSDTARLAAAANLEPGAMAAPLTLRLADESAAWPMAEALAHGQPVRLTRLSERLGALPGGPWPEAAHEAVLLPVARPGERRPYGVLIAGASPRKVVGQDYLEFFGLVAGHVASAITNGRARDQERRRAELLAELDRAKTTFFSNVSHELRTPITLLLGPADEALAAGDALPADDLARWQLVHRSASRLAKLVNTLLDFARIEAGRVLAVHEPTDLSAFTAELASLFRSAIERAGLRLLLDLPPLGEPAYVDREMWEKIVFNLLSNALKFTFEGEISVALRRRGDWLELEVADTGVGIAPDQLPQVFDRFHRAPVARARTHEGTGIGLALVQELAKLHGGSASVESEPNRGTRFRVTIPAGHAHLAPERLGPPRAAPAPAALSSTSSTGAHILEEASQWVSAAKLPPLVPAARAGGRARVMLADDNADMREYLSRLLGEHWEVEAVGDGQAALDAALRIRPDVVVADVMMPGLDGFALTAALRRDPSLRTVPIVLLSARAGEEATAEGLGAGANDYLVKPFSARELIVRIAAQLATVRTSRAAQVVAEEERARLYAHFMQAPFPIAVLRGQEHVFELANEAALRVWGKQPAILGQSFARAFPEMRGQPFGGYLDGVLRTGVAFEGTEALARLARGPDGALEDVYFNFVYTPLRNPAGEIEGVLVCGFEVTEQVQARQRVEALLAEVTAQSHEMQATVIRLREEKEAAERRAAQSDAGVRSC